MLIKLFSVSSGQSYTLVLHSMNECRPRKERQKYEIYPMAIRLEVVRLVESGHLHRQVQQQFGVSHATVWKWLQLYGSPVYHQMKQPRFTLAQRQHIARELLDGRLREEEALLKYGLRLKKTLREWVAAYQAEQAADPPPVGVLSGAEAGVTAALAAQLRQAQWQIEALHTLIDQAEATYRIDIRKKGGAKPSK